jgi:hypothetical protein
MRHLYGGINISQLAWDLGDYPRDATEGPIRTTPFSERKPVDQSLVRRWLYRNLTYQQEQEKAAGEVAS